MRCDPPDFDDGGSEWMEEPVAEPAPFSIEVEVTDNPIVAELLGPDGDVIREWRERPPIGFQSSRSYL